MKRQTRLKVMIAAGFIALAATPAAAASLTNALNLRSGPGTGYNVITSMPAGARVDVGPCSGGWCQVAWRGRQGYASASYISGESRARPRRALRRRAISRSATLGDHPLQRYRAPKYWGYNHDARPGGTNYRLGGYGPPF